MKLATHNKIADLVREAGQLAAKGQATAAHFTELAAWLNDCIDQDALADVEALKRLVRQENLPNVERYLTNMMRVVSGHQQVYSDDDRVQDLQLLAIPLFLTPRVQDNACVTLVSLECRYELERSLEAALGLPYASLRIADFPVKAIDLEQLTMIQSRQLALDILQQGDSPYLSPIVLDVGPDIELLQHTAMLWPMILRVNPEQLSQCMNQIAKAMSQSPALAQYKHRADELIEQELTDVDEVLVKSNIYMPITLNRVFEISQVIELQLVLNKALQYFKGKCLSVAFEIVGPYLRYSLLDKDAELIIRNEIRAPDDTFEAISTSLRRTCARFGVACTIAVN